MPIQLGDLTSVVTALAALTALVVSVVNVGRGKHKDEKADATRQAVDTTALAERVRAIENADKACRENVNTRICENSDRLDEFERRFHEEVQAVHDRISAMGRSLEGVVRQQTVMNVNLRHLMNHLQIPYQEG
jgi:hypothetical protein